MHFGLNNCGTVFETCSVLKHENPKILTTTQTRCQEDVIKLPARDGMTLAQPFKAGKYQPD
jgi:hypothetical protein